MKKSLFFAIDSLNVAGAEKSLVTLLSLLDYDRFSVDLMLFSHGNTLEELLPKEVNLLPPLSYTQFANLSLKKSVVTSLSNKDIKMLFTRIKYSSRIRQKKYSNPEKARVFWQSASKVIEVNPKKYDVAISYAQGVPTFYVAERVQAKKKFAWVNVSYHLNEKEKNFHRGYYDCYRKIISVSDSTKDVFIKTFPEYSKKLEVIYDINNPELISNMADFEGSYKDQFDGLRILTVGRLARQKGYDIALDACERLKNQGIKFKWYVLGKGPMKEEIEKEIKKRNLSNHFILLGVKANPYPYIKAADLYVQTSRFEGFGLAIAEARMLNVPVVTTRFDAVYNQMIDGRNGLVVNMNGEGVFQGIVKLIDNPNLKESITEYLKSEEKGNIEELSKFYKLIS
ncbi:glycosyltransferase [Halobacillus amylolyticus]|uniref:Glycosyltransferase n=1 Tax=Halobacillus amylolyticus TaxID=2932259 RepID=A0ABY4HGW2_9BACI|nr:glycosyltransferase [Halobacillus amylolyticus]UOR13786.1 glycosyltransferase [Halobacillus amylolyticus]